MSREMILGMVQAMEQFNGQALVAIERLDEIIARIEFIAQSDKLVELNARLDRIEQSLNRTRWLQ